MSTLVGGTGIIGQDIFCSFGNGKYTTFEGTEIVAENCLKARVKDLVVEGKTIQDIEDLSNIESVAEREGNVLSIVNNGKNLFNPNDTFITSSRLTISIANVNPNTNYYVKVYNSTYTGTFSYYVFINEEWIYKASLFLTRGVCIKTPNNCTKIGFNGFDESANTEKRIIQVEEGTVATSYEPYREPVATNINLPIPLRSLPNGTCDTIEGNKLVQRVGKVVLDENTEFNFPTSLVMANTVLIGLTISSIPKVYDSTISAICDKLQFKNIYSLDESGFFIDKTGTKLWLRLSISIYGSTLEEIKTNLALNPITIYYPLATPIIHNLEIPSMSTTKGTNIITTSNNIKPKISMKVKVK